MRPIPVTSLGNRVLWLGRLVTLSDFKDAMEYVEACMDPSKGSGHEGYEIITDAGLLQRLVRTVDALIPWIDEGEEEKLAWIVEARREMPLPTLSRQEPDYVREEVSRWSNQIRQTCRCIAAPDLLLDQYGPWANRFEQQFAAWRRRYQDFQASDAEVQEASKRLAKIQDGKVRHQTKKIRVKRLLRELSIPENWPRFNPKVQQLPWIILPGGESDWQMLLDSARETARLRPGRQLQPERLRLLHQRQPDAVYTGLLEFDGYYVFVFKRLGKTVFENPFRGNAAFVVEGSWQSLSQLTKSQLEKCPGVERIIHSSSDHWKDRLLSALCRPPSLHLPTR
jgi:hypothetical protein